MKSDEREAQGSRHVDNNEPPLFVLVLLLLGYITLALVLMARA